LPAYQSIYTTKSSVYIVRVSHQYHINKFDLTIIEITYIYKLTNHLFFGMKTNLFFLSAILLLTISLTSQAQQNPPAKKTPPPGSKAYTVAKTAEQSGASKQGVTSKLPSVIVKISNNDTLTITFEYGTNRELKKVNATNAKGEKETILFQYTGTSVSYTHSYPDYPDQNETGTLTTNGNLVTKDKYYEYIYKDNRLVEHRPLMKTMSSYTIDHDNAGNAVQQIRVIPPLMGDDDEVIQTATYKYDMNVKCPYFFSTDNGIQSVYVGDPSDDVYRMCNSGLFGTASPNLLIQVTNDSKPFVYQYKYLSFDESGYPTHYAIYEISDFDHSSDRLSDYTITYIGK